MGPVRTGYPFLDDPGPVLAFAHRGGDAHGEILGLENTLTAFRHAVSLGYRYLETDVHTTRDGVLLAFHDSVLERVTDGTGALAALDLDDVRRARVRGRESVPTLAELFEACPEARFNIDLKSDGAVAALAAFLEHQEAHDRVLVASFSHRRLRAFRRRVGSRVATSASPPEIALAVLLPARAARWALRDVAALQIPTHARLPLLGRRMPLATAGLVERMHRLGKQVHVWTVDDAAEQVRLLGLGVDGLMTDRTDVLRATLERLGRWRGEDGSETHSETHSETRSETLSDTHGQAGGEETSVAKGRGER